MKWMLFFQTPQGSVAYINDSTPNVSYLPYYKFLEFLNRNFITQKPLQLKEELDRFRTIVLNCTTGNWEIKSKTEKEVTFEELLDLNQEEEKKDNHVTSDYLKGLKKSLDKLVKSKNPFAT